MAGRFWLDADTLIRAKNDHYGFDIAPGFWDAIKQGASSGKVSSPSAVLDEISKGGDELTVWANGERGTKLFQPPDQKVQKIYQQIALYVRNNYSAPQLKFFLAGADGWLIAAAQQDAGVVVTHEVLVGPGSKKVKIPNLCNVFDVKYVNCFEMLRRLGVKLR